MMRLFKCIILCLFTQYSFAQIEGIWNGGMAFDGEDDDSLLLFQFDNGKFHFNYGPNHYPQYTNYTLKNDTLILLQNHRFQQAAFRIIELTDGTLNLQAINWSAVYITNSLCLPWANPPAPKISRKEDFDTEAILKDETVNSTLSFKHLKSN